MGSMGGAAARVLPARIKRGSSITWVRISDITIHPDAQRKLNVAWVNQQAKLFNPEALGLPVVCRFDERKFYAIDGQHRIALLRAVGWGDQQIECEVYEGLTLEEMATEFLLRNKKTNTRTFDKFRIRITAKDPVAVGVEQIIHQAGLVLSDQGSREGAVTAVAALERIYTGAGLTDGSKHGPRALERTIATVCTAWGKSTSGFVGDVIEGLGLVQLRYSGLEQAALAQKLASFNGGAAGVLGQARSLREMRGGTIPHCVAGVVIELYNRGRKNKLESWWK